MLGCLASLLNHTKNRKRWLRIIEELEVYQLSYDLSSRVHPFSFKMPKYETYELGSQIRRSADSVNSNIVEGYGRRRYKNDFIN
ncbi:MAG: four helix bundle protein [Bacteroidota bacterium]